MRYVYKYTSALPSYGIEATNTLSDHIDINQNLKPSCFNTLLTMALLSLGPVVSHVLILVVAMSNICILSYDAGMINNLNAVQPYFERSSTTLSQGLPLTARQTSASTVISSVSTSPSSAPDVSLALR
jgi:hypothetical protein